MIKVKRFFLEILKENYKNVSLEMPDGIELKLEKKNTFELNKFFYRNIGLDHYWRDRLIWTDKEWFKYVGNKNLETWVMRKNKKYIGFYEQEFHPVSNEIELINMGILKEFREKKFGSLILKHSIHTAFKKKIKKMWVHTCSLDHKNALLNYKSKGFKIYKEEEISFVA